MPLQQVQKICYNNVNGGDEATNAYATSRTDRQRSAMVQMKMSGEEDHGSQPETLSRWKRWLSLRAYGLVTSTLFGATTPPMTMRGRFERLSRVSRQAMQRKFPKLVFGDHAVDGLAIESVCAVESPVRVILYLHGGAFFMGSPTSYRNRAMRLSYRCQAEVKKACQATINCSMIQRPRDPLSSRLTRASQLDCRAILIPLIQKKWECMHLSLA